MEKIRRHAKRLMLWLPLLTAVGLLIFLINIGKADDGGMTSAPPPCLYFTYSPWSPCADNQQTRTVLNSFPAGCVGGTPEALTKNCCQWQCSDWSACQSGLRTRMCTVPSGCNSVDMPSIPVLQETCAVASQPCQYTYSDWSQCVSGYRHRQIVSRAPDGCVGGEPELYQTCETAVYDCSYAYSDWGVCASGKQFRQVTGRTPAGCRETSPLIEQACTSTYSGTEKPNCQYTYSDWSECVNGQQYRRVTGRAPEGCQDTTSEILRTCQTTATENPKPPACLKDEWQCDNWGPCLSTNKRVRVCRLNFDCPSVTNERPLMIESCLFETQTTKEPVNNTEPRQETTTEPRQSIEEPRQSLEEPKQALEAPKPATVAQPPAQENPVESTQPKIEQTDVSNEENEIYLRQTVGVTECLSKNLTTRAKCREYQISAYGQLKSCDQLKPEECSRLYNEIILSDLPKAEMSTQVKDDLARNVGRSAVLNTQDKSLTVNRPADLAKEENVNNRFEVNEIPFASRNRDITINLVPVKLNDDQRLLAPIALSFDQDGDGLPDELELRLGTKPDSADTDNDGYDDATEIRTGNDPLKAKTRKITELTGIEKAILDRQPLEQPKFAALPIDDNLKIDSVVTVDSAEPKLEIKGRAAPNQILTLYIYSAMPIVVTVQADQNGNWVYNLDKTLVDGKHEVYVAVNTDEGNLAAASAPSAFLIKEAKAVSTDDFIRMEDATVAPDNASNFMMFYAAGSLALILLLVSVFLFIRKKLLA